MENENRKKPVVVTDLMKEIIEDEKVRWMDGFLKHTNFTHADFLSSLESNGYDLSGVELSKEQISFVIYEQNVKSHDRRVVTRRAKSAGTPVEVDGHICYPMKVLGEDAPGLNSSHIRVTEGNIKFDMSLLEKRSTELEITGYTRRAIRDQLGGECSEKRERKNFFFLTEVPKVAKIQKVANAVDKEQGIKI